MKGAVVEKWVENREEADNAYGNEGIESCYFYNETNYKDFIEKN